MQKLSCSLSVTFPAGSLIFFRLVWPCSKLYFCVVTHCFICLEKDALFFYCTQLLRNFAITDIKYSPLPRVYAMTRVDCIIFILSFLSLALFRYVNEMEPAIQRSNKDTNNYLNVNLLLETSHLHNSFLTTIVSSSLFPSFPPLVLLGTPSNQQWRKD